MLYRAAFRISLLALTLAAGAAAGQLAAQTVEMVARVDPGRYSDTGAPPAGRTDLIPVSAGVPVLSADGRYAAFVSSAPNLVPGQQDANHAGFNPGNDVFLKDLVTGEITLVSHSMSSPTTTGNGISGSPVISADGRYVAFLSVATDLAPGQQEHEELSDKDALLFDRVTGAVTLVAATAEDRRVQGDLSISADGRYVAFASDTSSHTNVYFYDRVENRTRLASHVPSSPTIGGNSSSEDPKISADGRFIVFSTFATDLVFGVGQSVVLYDRTTDSLSLIGQGKKPQISDDGGVIAFGSNFDLKLYDRQARTATLVAGPPGQIGFGEPNTTFSLSGNGRFLAYVHGGVVPPGIYDWSLRIYDRESRTSTEASRPATVPPRNVSAPRISVDGRFTVFTSTDSNVIAGQADTNQGPDVFLYDRISGTTELLSNRSTSAPTTGDAGDRPSDLPGISADGSRVVFSGAAAQLIAGVRDFNDGEDFFVYETASKSRSLVTRRDPGIPALSSSTGSTARALSADGRWVAFESDSPHLVPGQTDANGTTDVFLYDRATRTTLLVSRASAAATTAANGKSAQPVISANGRYVAFLSNAPDLAPGANDPAGGYDLFLFDRVAGTTSLVARLDLRFTPRTAEPPWHRISPDGRWVAFLSYAADLVPGQREPVFPDGSRSADVFLRDQFTGSTILVSRSSRGAAVAGNGSSFLSALSADGRFVLFTSGASDLVPGQTGTPFSTLFLFDRVSGTTAVVSHARDSVKQVAAGGEAALSADGRFVAFASPDGGLAANGSNTELHGVYLYDRTSQANHWIGYGYFPRPALSADGRYVAFNSHVQLLPGVHPLGYTQVYLYDRITKALSLVTRSSASDDGGNDFSLPPAISTDGRYVTYSSYARDLVPGQVPLPWPRGLNVYLFDRTAGTNTLVNRRRGSAVESPGGSGFEPNLESPLLSANGRQVAFTNSADLTERDFNNLPDAHVFSLDPPPAAGGPVSVPPCTLLDTRRRADRPVLTSNAQRTVTVRGSCSVPATAQQVVVKVTVFNPSGKGNLRFYPGAVTATSSGLLRFERNVTRTETFTLPLGTNGTLTILPFVAGQGTVHVAVEVNGYTQ